MSIDLQARRQKLINKLAVVDRQITVARKQLVRLKRQIASLEVPKAKVA